MHFKKNYGKESSFMIKTTTLTLHTVVTEDKLFFLWVENENRFVVPVNDWTPLLFSWHDETFFGTMLEEMEYNGKQGVALTPWKALDFFARKPFSSLAEVTFSDETDYYKKTAIKLFQALRDGTFRPSFAFWKDGIFGWEVDKHSNEYERGWLTAALRELFSEDETIREAWTAIREQYPLLDADGRESFISQEKFWLERIGWQKDDTPFTVGLRLREPEDDEELWSLDITLRCKNNPDELHIFKKENVSELPKRWRASLHRIDEECDYWFRVDDSLQDKNGELRTSLTEIDVWLFLTETSVQLAESGTEVLLPAWWKELQASEPKLKVKVKSSVGQSQQSFVGLNQLIDFDWKLATGGIDLSEEEFQKLIEQNRRLIRVNGRWVKLDPTFIDKIQTIMKQVNETGVTFADLLTRELIVDDNEDDADHPLQHVTFELNKHLINMIKQLTETKQLPSVPVPKELNGELRPYQKTGMEWLLFLRKYGLGALLADDMGLGKTIQTIAYSLAIKDRERPKQPILIICPTSVLGNWQREFQRFAPSLSVLLHYGPNRATKTTLAENTKDIDIVITSYNLAHLDEDVLTSIDWQAVCLDEAQNIKNAYTKQAKAVKQLKAKHRIALTGTPIENRLTELWSIFEFLNPGYFGSLRTFREKYVLPIEREDDREKMKHVQQLIRPFFMRRSKLDPDIELNLPDKLEQKEYCPLTAEQASLYEQIIEDTFREIDKRTGIERSGFVLSMLTKLKQICNHPALFLKEDSQEQLHERSHKTKKLVELVTDIRERGESCLIFTQYIAMGNLLQTLLAKTFQTNISFLHGGLSKAERDRIVERFQQGEEHILILSLKAGGTGLNLTAANHVIHYDRWWNPAVENQATDRAHRIGQQRFVHVHKLITTGTLEEKIDEMLERKQLLSDEIIQSENWITELPTEELRELFTLRHTQEE